MWNLIMSRLKKSSDVNLVREVSISKYENCLEKFLWNPKPEIIGKVTKFNCLLDFLASYLENYSVLP